MIIDVRGVATGKTHDLVIDATKTGGTIVCGEYMVKTIREMANAMQVYIMDPITHEEFIDELYDTSDIPCFYIDSLDTLLQLMSGGTAIKRINISTDTPVSVLTGELEDNLLLCDKQATDYPYSNCMGWGM